MPNDKYLISIVTPVYNASEFIEATIESVLQQTYTNWEWYLVNDCSTDNSAELIEKYVEADSRIHLLHLSDNQGAAVARNTGLAQAAGDYIAFIDSDDVWHPEKIAQQLAFMRENAYVFSYTDLALMNEAGEIFKDKVDVPKKLNYSGLLKNTAIACSTVMINLGVLGDFRMPEVRKGQDTATWLMLMREHDITAYGLPKVLNYYRQVEGSISSNRLGALRRTWHTYRQLEKLPMFKALYYFSHYVFNAVMRRL